VNDTAWFYVSLSFGKSVVLSPIFVVICIFAVTVAGPCALDILL